MSNDTIRSRIDNLDESMKRRLISEIKKSSFFAMNESTDVANLCQLLVFLWYIHEQKIEEVFLFCQLLETSVKTGDVMQHLSSFCEEHNLNLDCLGGSCMDGTPAMLRSRSGLITLIQQKRPLT